MFKKFKNTNFKKFLSMVAILCFLLVVLAFVCWLNLISYINAGIWLKPKFLYLYMYYEWDVIYWILLAHFSLNLPLFKQ